MGDFSADWLALREPADHRARSRYLVARLSEWTECRPLRVVDLGCGTGSTFRALEPYLSADTHWTLVDFDPALIAAADASIGGTNSIDFVVADLARGVEQVLDRPVDLVTGSALIDLCSAAWLDRLAATLPARAALYMALSYDGIERWEPAHPAEAAALAAFHAHQHGEKGFGPALGPDAAPHLARALEARGWTVELAPSPWRLGPSDRALIAALADGAAAAVAETGALPADMLAAWATARRTAERVEVGHTDLLALPPR